MLTAQNGWVKPQSQFCLTVQKYRLPWLHLMDLLWRKKLFVELNINKKDADWLYKSSSNVETDWPTGELYSSVQYCSKWGAKVILTINQLLLMVLDIWSNPDARETAFVLTKIPGPLFLSALSYTQQHVKSINQSITNLLFIISGNHCLGDLHKTQNCTSNHNQCRILFVDVHIFTELFL